MDEVLTLVECLERWKKKPIVNVGPAKHWLTSYKQGVWGYNNFKTNVTFWNNLQEGDVILFYSAKRPPSAKVSGLLGLGVFSNKYIKDAPLWFDDYSTNTNEWPRSIQFKYSYFFGDTEKINTSTPAHKYSTEQLNTAVNNLTTNAVLYSDLSAGPGGNLPINSSASIMRDMDLVRFIIEKVRSIDVKFRNYTLYLDNDQNDDEECLQYKIENDTVSIDELILKRTKSNKEEFHSVSEKVKKKRDQRLYHLLKIKFNYTCQACDFKLLNKRGKYYIEACHITPHNEAGNQDYPENILILCPNCHKRFDHGMESDRASIQEKIESKHNQYNYKKDT